MLNLRKVAKSYIPNVLVNYVRKIVEGKGIETHVLKPYGYEYDPDLKPRLNLVMPSLSAKAAFGGVSTGLAFFSSLHNELSKLIVIDARIITEDIYDSGDSAIKEISPVVDDSKQPITVLSLKAEKGVIPTRKFDIFLVYNWWVAHNLLGLLGQQARQHQYKQMPKLQLIQEFEPAFYPMSSAQLIALESLGPSQPQWSIFNSSLLKNYCAQIGLIGSKSYVFEPRLDKRLMALQPHSKSTPRKRQILVYGRPSIKRNCFSILEYGLRAWAQNSKYTKDWKVLSAGTKHKDIELANGVAIQSIGKLSYAGYGGLLSECAIGISLMASPHPSYPPLEMAHFGMLTLTNKYLLKDLSKFHQNINSLADVRPETIAAAIDNLIEKFEANAHVGAAGLSFFPDFVSEKPFDCIDVLSQDVLALIGERSKV
jgi:O-antigen biosynthesis protein